MLYISSFIIVVAIRRTLIGQVSSLAKEDLYILANVITIAFRHSYLSVLKDLLNQTDSRRKSRESIMRTSINCSARTAAKLTVLHSRH